jgi:putative transport protein
MMDWLVTSLRSYPEIVVFLAVGIGYWIGNYKFGNFSLGVITASLMAGLVIGSLHVEPSRDLRWGFFTLFLFANGYSVGPQFFQALKKDGVKPMLLSVVMCFTGLFTAYLLARLLGLDPGMAAGLFSGGTTQSAAMGTAGDAISGLAIPDEQKKLFISHIAIADALCYVFGAIGVIWFCGNVAPWVLGIDLKTESKALEATLGIKDETAGVYSANQMFSVRAYRVGAKDGVVGEKVFDVEGRKPGATVFIYRILRKRSLLTPTPETTIAAGDVLVLYGHTNLVVAFGDELGSEVVEPDVLDFPMEVLKVVVTNPWLTTLNMVDIRALPQLRCVTARSLTRGGEEILAGTSTQPQAGDVVELVGPQDAVERAVKIIGYPMRPSAATPLSIIGIGIFVGGLIGLPYFMLGGVKITLTVSVGVLLAGLFAGWLRTKRPVLPSVPDAAIQIMITLGLAVFVACTGIQAGPHFIDAVKTLGVPLLLSGVAVTMLPLFVGLFFGRAFLGMHPIILLGAISGAQTYTGGMAAVQEKSESRVAILGYTVPYATSNILLTLFGSVIVSLIAR